jgi:predicted dehydrogenase
MNDSEPRGVGVIGAGVISEEYLATLAAAAEVDVRFVADLDPARAAAQAAKHGVPASGTYDELLADRTVELVVNLTVPAVHAEVTSAALSAGRHVWSEKPLAASLDDAQALVALADEHGLRLGCAPDTFLGTGFQTALAEIRSGRIGTPRTGFASCQSRGPDFWHPSPEFLFAPGGGPVLDYGPYYVTALTLIFGSVAEVTARGLITRPQRTIGAGPRAGERFDVGVPTHVTALYEFTDGALVDAVFSVDSAVRRSALEVAGTEGTLVLPDPGRFDGDTVALSLDATESEVPAGGTGGRARGAGVIEMVRALHVGEPHRADARRALHVLEVLLATEEAVRTRQTVQVRSRAPQTALLADGWTPMTPGVRPA